MTLTDAKPWEDGEDEACAAEAVERAAGRPIVILTVSPGGATTTCGIYGNMAAPGIAHALSLGMRAVMMGERDRLAAELKEPEPMPGGDEAATPKSRWGRFKDWIAGEGQPMMTAQVGLNAFMVTWMIGCGVNFAVQGDLLVSIWACAAGGWAFVSLGAAMLSLRWYRLYKSASQRADALLTALLRKDEAPEPAKVLH